MKGANWPPERPGGSANPGLTSRATPVLECVPRPSAHRSCRSGALRTTTSVGPNCDQQSPCAGAPRSTARQRIGGAAEEPAKERCAVVHPSPRTILISAPTCEMDLRRSTTSQHGRHATDGSCSRRVRRAGRQDVRPCPEEVVLTSTLRIECFRSTGRAADERRNSTGPPLSASWEGHASAASPGRQARS